jgi:hypothetical protein
VPSGQGPLARQSTGAFTVADCGAKVMVTLRPASTALSGLFVIGCIEAVFNLSLECIAFDWPYDNQRPRGPGYPAYVLVVVAIDSKGSVLCEGMSTSSERVADGNLERIANELPATIS